MSLGGLLAGFLSATSASPGDFHSIADISCPDGATGCRIELPAWVAEVQPAGGDGRTWAVSTERGEPLPWSHATDSVAPAETTWTDLPLLPLDAAPVGTVPERLSLAVADGRFALQWSRDSGSSPATITRWILDLRTIRPTVLEIAPAAGDFLGSIAIEGGDDLVRWSPRGAASLARIDSGTFSVRRLRIPLEERRDMFLRLSWNPAEGAFAIRGVRGGVAGTTPSVPARRDDLGVSGRGDSGWTFDARGRSPVVGAFVEFRRRGAYGQFVLETRSAPDSPWILASSAFGWHRGTRELAFHNDTLWFTSPLRARYWRVRATGSAATMGDSVRLVLRLRPDRIEFPTGGAARLVFAAGMDPQAFARLVPGSGAIPGDPAHGMLGSPRMARGEAALVAMPDHRTWILGGTLVLAVLAMLGLAWRLWRDADRLPKERTRP